MAIKTIAQMKNEIDGIWLSGNQKKATRIVRDFFNHQVISDDDDPFQTFMDGHKLIYSKELIHKLHDYIKSQAQKSQQHSQELAHAINTGEQGDDLAHIADANDNIHLNLECAIDRLNDIQRQDTLIFDVSDGEEMAEPISKDQLIKIVQELRQ